MQPLSWPELYARVDPFGQIAATNFKKNMSSPSSQLSSPPRRARRIRPHRRVPSFRRTLMRKISKRRSSSSLADPLNRQEWSRMAVLQGRSGSIPFRTTRNESFSTRVKTNESLKSSLHFLSVESRTVLRGCDSRDWRIFVICRKD